MCSETFPDDFRQHLGFQFMGGPSREGGEDGFPESLAARSREQEGGQGPLEGALLEDKSQRRVVRFQGPFHLGPFCLVEGAVEVGGQMIAGNHEGSALSLRSMQVFSCWRTRQRVVRTQARLRCSRRAISSDDCSSR